ncbi:TRAP transporter large permease subunit [Bacillus sp. JJ1474]|uniref:TRAP transporter large permease subunit n=1 Tax=Bacillus sp. JJ1474 TaxID=3122955 RepID=UPI003000CD79
MLGRTWLEYSKATAIDPLQFSMVVIIVWAIGQQQPPIASEVNITTAIAKVSMLKVSKYNIYPSLIYFFIRNNIHS